MLKKFYLAAAIVGLVLPYIFLGQYLANYGFKVTLFIEHMFENPVVIIFVLDVLVSSVILWIFIFTEGRKLGMKNLWAYIVANLLVGMCFALPLFLYFREDALEAVGEGTT